MVNSSDKKHSHQGEILDTKEGLRRQEILTGVSIRVEVVIQSKPAQIIRTAPMDLCN
jgi:hypothetical protein